MYFLFFRLVLALLLLLTRYLLFALHWGADRQGGVPRGYRSDVHPSRWYRTESGQGVPEQSQEEKDPDHNLPRSSSRHFNHNIECIIVKYVQLSMHILVETGC
nr:unnamed protein product [Callosobruchus analis]